MTELEKAARGVHSHLSVALSDSPRANVPIATSILREWYEALGAALEAEAGWIAVKDKLPPQHQDVWCRNRDGYQFQGRICTGMHEPFFTYPRGDGCPSNTAPSWIDVTHWRPLPGCPLVDYSRDQALHPHAGDGDICSRCGEHRSWHSE